MARLATIKPRLSPTKMRFGKITEATEQARDQVRRDSKDYRSWYNLARWCAAPTAARPSGGLRWRVLMRDLFTCQRCGYLSRHPRASDMVADHIRPHRGDELLFWAEGNLQCLCKACHDGAKQSEERREV